MQAQNKHYSRQICEWLIKSVIVYLIVFTTWISVVILGLIHARKADFLEGLYLLGKNQPCAVRKGGARTVIHNNCANRMPHGDDESFKFLPYQLWTVR